MNTPSLWDAHRPTAGSRDGTGPGVPVRYVSFGVLLARHGVLGFPAGGGFALVVQSFAGEEEFAAELYWDDNDDNTDNIDDA